MNRSTVPTGLDDPSLRGAMRLAIHLRAYLPLYVMAVGFVMVATLLPTVNKPASTAAGTYGAPTAGGQVAADPGGGPAAASGDAGAAAGGPAAAASAGAAGKTAATKT